VTTVLVAHPDSVTVRRIARACSDWGYRTTPLGDPSHVVREAVARAPDLVIVGHDLPSDTAACSRELLEIVRTKVIALAYPIACRERLVAAGVSAVVAPRTGRMTLRRAVRQALHEAALGRQLHLTPTVRLGGFTHIALARVAFADGRGLCLTRIENALLQALTARPGEVVLHHILTKAAWPRKACHQVRRKLMQYHIHNLRRKLARYGPDAPTIELSCLNGYRLIPKGEVVVIRRPLTVSRAA
jgi:DNA-binding response OmpR family regulator